MLIKLTSSHQGFVLHFLYLDCVSIFPPMSIFWERATLQFFSLNLEDGKPFKKETLFGNKVDYISLLAIGMLLVYGCRCFNCQKQILQRSSIWKRSLTGSSNWCITISRSLCYNQQLLHLQRWWSEALFALPWDIVWQVSVPAPSASCSCEKINPSNSPHRPFLNLPSESSQFLNKKKKNLVLSGN